MHILNSLTVVVALFATSTVYAQSAIDEHADRLLREMGEYLSSAEEFSFRAEIGYAVDPAK